ncbi:unnamed protein product [Phaeothamnion confervicola]
MPLLGPLPVPMPVPKRAAAAALTAAFLPSISPPSTAAFHSLPLLKRRSEV